MTRARRRLFADAPTARGPRRARRLPARRLPHASTAAIAARDGDGRGRRATSSRSACRTATRSWTARRSSRRRASPWRDGIKHRRRHPHRRGGRGDRGADAGHDLLEPDRALRRRAVRRANSPRPAARGVITPDLTPEEAGAVARGHRRGTGSTRVFLVAPQLHRRAHRHASPRRARGFVYAASPMGVTGTRDVGRRRGRGPGRAHPGATTDLPVCVGLGVSHRRARPPRSPPSPTASSSARRSSALLLDAATPRPRASPRSPASPPSSPKAYAVGCDVHPGNFRGRSGVCTSVPRPRPVRLTRAAALAGAAATLLLSGCGASDAGAPAGVVVALNDNDGYAGALVDPGYPLPTSSFTDTSGADWTFAKGATRPVTLVFFGYSSSPTCAAPSSPNSSRRCGG